MTSLFIRSAEPTNTNLISQSAEELYRSWEIYKITRGYYKEERMIIMEKHLQKNI